MITSCKCTFDSKNLTTPMSVHEAIDAVFDEAGKVICMLSVNMLKQHLHKALCAKATVRMLATICA